MRSEKEIREHLEKLKKIELAIHPSLVKTVEWVLEEGDPEEQKIWLEIMDGMIESVERNNYDFTRKRKPK